jgi:hypothetical protein
VFPHPAQAGEVWPPALIGSLEAIIKKKIVGAKHGVFCGCSNGEPRGDSAFIRRSTLLRKSSGGKMGLLKHRHDKERRRWSDSIRVGEICMSFPPLSKAARYCKPTAKTLRHPYELLKISFDYRARLGARPVAAWIAKMITLMRIVPMSDCERTAYIFLFFLHWKLRSAASPESSDEDHILGHGYGTLIKHPESD